MATATARYPNVPIAPGVPAVFRNETNPGTNGAATSALTADAPGVATASGARWGIFKAGGAVALECDSVVALDPRREFRISDYAVADGGFASYNKVATPGEVRITVTKGGTDSDRQSFFDALDKLIESVELFNIVTPDSSFLDRNLVRYDYSRSSIKGMTLITVEIITVEVRQTARVAFADSKQPSGAPSTNTGPVQATPSTVKETPTPAASYTNPDVAAVPALTAASTAAQKASTVSRIIQAGGSINDLAAKGVSFQTIPTIARAAQTLTTSIGGQSVRLNIAQKSTGLFTDVFVNDALVIGGVLVENDNPIVRSAYLGFAGDLFLHDTQAAGSDAPAYSDLGDRYALLYAGA